MRILTPAGVRQVESVRDMIVKGYGFIVGSYIDEDSGTLNLDMDSETNKELWLNILDLALRQSESLGSDWRKDKAPNWTDEVYNKLRPKL